MHIRRQKPDPDALAADSETENAPANAVTMLGNRECSALRCTSSFGAQCAYVDRRGRRCRTAWCPEDRVVIHGKIYCTIHAHTMNGIEHEFGSSVHPDVDNKTVAIITWLADAARDDVVASLNVMCALRNEVLVSEPVRRVFHPVERTRIWEKQWKTLSTTGVSMRVCICADEARPNDIHIKVNGEDVNVVPPPWNQALDKPNRADLEWLYQEVLMPITWAVERRITLEEDHDDDSYVAPWTTTTSYADMTHEQAPTTEIPTPVADATETDVPGIASMPRRVTSA